MAQCSIMHYRVEVLHTVITVLARVNGGKLKKKGLLTTYVYLTRDCQLCKSSL